MAEVVHVLAQLKADSAQFVAGMKNASRSLKTIEKDFKKTRESASRFFEGLGVSAGGLAATYLLARAIRTVGRNATDASGSIDSLSRSVKGLGRSFSDAVVESSGGQRFLRDLKNAADFFTNLIDQDLATARARFASAKGGPDLFPPDEGMGGGFFFSARRRSTATNVDISQMAARRLGIRQARDYESASAGLTAQLYEEARGQVVLNMAIAQANSERDKQIAAAESMKGIGQAQIQAAIDAGRARVEAEQLADESLAGLRREQIRQAVEAGKARVIAEQETAAEVEAIYQGAAMGIASSFGNTLGQMIVQGQAFADITKKLVSDLVAYLIAEFAKLAAFSWIASLFGIPMGGTSFFGGLVRFHEGGMVGDPIRAHDGWNIRRDEVPIIAQTGERVLSRDQNADVEDMLSGGRQTQVVVQLDGRQLGKALVDLTRSGRYPAVLQGA